jgi:hypothetical protein
MNLVRKSFLFWIGLAAVTLGETGKTVKSQWEKVGTRLARRGIT